MLISYIPLLVAIVGLLMWVLASNPKVSEAGRILFFCGALITTYSLAGQTVKLFGH